MISPGKSPILRRNEEEAKKVRKSAIIGSAKESPERNDLDLLAPSFGAGWRPLPTLTIINDGINGA